MMETRQLDFIRTVGVAPAEVYRAFIHPTALRDWFCNFAHIEARPGGRVYFWWNDGYAAGGEVRRAEAGQALQYTWRGPAESLATDVLVLIEPAEGGAQVKVVHSGIPTDPAWDATVAEFRQGWTTGLENLQSMLETGFDLRQVRRPMMGIFYGQFDADIATKIGVPTSKGVKVEGTMEGLSARAIGLVANDVIVSLDGQPVDDPDGLSPIIRAHKAGDRLAVAYYRGAELRSAVLELAPRPLPDFPKNVPDLVALTEKDAAKFQADLGQNLAACSEEQAERRTGPREWNVKETLAHLIACERDLQTWIADMLNDRPYIDDSLEYSPNVFERIQAMVTLYPNVPALLAELKLSQAETAALLARLPESFLARKHFFNRVSDWMASSSNHYQEHLDQIGRLLAGN